MHAALVVLAHVISNATPAPAPTTVVLDGCNTASAVRAAEIGTMRPGHADTVAAVADLLLEKDGAICLLESDVLVDVYRAQPKSDIAPRALVGALASNVPHVARRAAELVSGLGLEDPKAFDRLLRRDEMNRRGWNVLRAELATLAPSPRTSVLQLIADRAAPVARAD